MELITHVGFWSYASGALLFLVLSLLLLVGWRGRLDGGLLILASVISTVWCGVLAWNSAYEYPSLQFVQIIEVLRDAAWLTFLIVLLRRAYSESQQLLRGLNLFTAALAFVCIGLLTIVVLDITGISNFLPYSLGVNTLLSAHLIIALGGLILVEQLYHNVAPERRWAIKFFCIGAGSMFAYEFFMYSDALLFKRVDIDLWNARGAVNAFVVPLIAVSAKRNPQWSVDVFVSRHVVFHSASMLGAGIYLLVMAVSGYYIRNFGGSWGGVLQVVFLFGVLVMLFIMLFSGELRARLKVYLSKHFFSYKYDYHDEWLKFTNALSNPGEGQSLQEVIIKAVADIMGSPGGVLWTRGRDGDYVAVAYQNVDVLPQASEPESGSLPRFMIESGWVININGYHSTREKYQGLELPDWLSEIPEAWLIIPLIQHDSLEGFMVLIRPDVLTPLNWEDSDMLKTAGRQAASYLALYELTGQLAEARQFEAFNRLSAFIVHDLKNLIAQLSLVSRNARKHMHQPEFIEDAMGTVENAVGKMSRLMEQLRKNRTGVSNARPIPISTILREVIQGLQGKLPVPVITESVDDLMVLADRDRLAAIMEHLVQNAQEATEDDGKVEIRLKAGGNRAIIEIEDTGTGMDADFVANRLFRPFDTTKGNAGMGVGVYEAREYVVAQGGRIEVTSVPEQGTEFRVSLPVHQRDQQELEHNKDGSGK